MDPAPRPLAASPAAAVPAAVADRPGTSPQSALLSPPQSQQAPEQQLTWALAHFQAEVLAIASPDLGAVAAAARPALRGGLSWSARLGEQHGRSRLQVTLRHAAGAELSSETWAPETSDLAGTAGLLLAMLLGIPVSCQAQAVKPCDLTTPSGAGEPAAGPGQADGPGQEVGPDPQPGAPKASEQVPGATEHPSGASPVAEGDPALLPLSEDEIGDCHRRILALPPNTRREFTNAFREHFAVPRSARSIGDRINQRQHGLFLEHFLAEAQSLNPSQEQGQGPSQSQSQGQTQTENQAQPEVLDAAPLPLVP